MSNQNCHLNWKLLQSLYQIPKIHQYESIDFPYNMNGWCFDSTIDLIDANLIKECKINNMVIIVFSSGGFWDNNEMNCGIPILYTSVRWTALCYWAALHLPWKEQIAIVHNLTGRWNRLKTKFLFYWNKK